MPCSDGREDTSKLDNERKIRELKERNNQLMRVICKIDTFLEGYGIDLPELYKDAEVRAVLQEHRVSDEDRWNNHYSVKYPHLSKDEIAKLVRAGILEDI